MQKQYHPSRKVPTPTPSHVLSSLRNNNIYKQGSTGMVGNAASDLFIPHKGSLYRVESEDSHEPTYIVEIRISQDEDEIDFMNDTITSRELRFSNYDFTVASRLFAILDTDNTNVVSRNVVKDFVYKRCPVFSKRDDDLIRLQLHSSRNDPSGSSSYEFHRCSTFDEIWNSVSACSRSDQRGASEARCLGIEGWLVFCRFIALTQYLEAKRRFSARHSQRNSPYGSEVVMVDVPPPEPPTAISPQQLAKYEDRNESGVPLPELDLDHSLLAAHDITARRRSMCHDVRSSGEVKIALFGVASDNRSISSSNLEFAITFTRRSTLFSTTVELEEGVVRRSMVDMIWLNDTFTSHRVLGGTLCGRILPPFPPTASSSNGVLSSHFPIDESSFNTNSIKSSTGGAINAAAAGVGRLRDAAKSLISPLSLFMSSPSPTDVRSDESLSAATASHVSQQNAKKNSRKKRSLSLALPENYYNPNSPVGKARQLERYLNYLLQHPALSTSFPLNAMLTASQAGLEAARATLSDCVRVSKELQEQASHVYDGKNTSPNFTWVRTVAQAAIAMQLHGILENSGMPSASARLQHASLPALGATMRVASWDENDVVSTEKQSTSNTNSANTRELFNFEDGVVNDDGFDLLPLPVPAPERRILTVGSTPVGVSEAPGEERFHYGSGNLETRYPFHVEGDNGTAFLGDIAIDENIDKLREVIGSVDNTFSRCLISSGEIGKANRERLNLHLNIIRGLDSWEGMRGRFIGQRSLMKGVAGVEQSKEIHEESDLALIDDLSWQTALANSAVTAAEDVRAAIRVARTASNARAAASSAALTAQTACERGEFASIDEARAAQTRASIAQSHAIHAAVVEHEANTVKRRATLALANDVETWNVHRKKEMLRTCISFARSQHQATRRGVDAWSTLRDGFIGAPMNPSIAERKTISQTHLHPPVNQPALSLQPSALNDSGEVSSTIFDDSPTIVAVDHNVLSFIDSHSSVTLPPVQEEETDASQSSKVGMADSIKSTGNDFHLPFAEAAPIIESANDLISFDNYTTDYPPQQNLFGSRTSTQDHRQQQQDASFTDETMGESMQSIVNGIINKWGLGFESDDDHLALPVGMAASILLEDDHHNLAPNGISFNIV